MGFWNIMSTFGSLYSEYYKGKSIEDLCRDINSRGSFAFSNIQELSSRARNMSTGELKDYYYEYCEYDVEDAANVFYEELKSRGYFLYFLCELFWRCV